MGGISHAFCGFCLGNNNLIKSMFACSNLVPILVATFSSNMNMNGFRIATSASVNRIRKVPYSNALRMKMIIHAAATRGHKGIKIIAAG